MRIKYVIQLFVLAAPIFISACRPYQPTPIDALTEWPGELEGANSTVLESVQVLKEEEVAGGLVILYSIPSAEPGENVLASTFVTPEGNGWRAQSSGWIDYSDTDDFVVTGIAGGNITDLTTMSGISSKGEVVRIEWSDGQIDITPIEGGSFVFARPETLTVRRVELLDGRGSVLESRDFEEAEVKATAQTQSPAETPGPIMMATPTVSPASPTRIPMNDTTGIPQIDHVVETILSNDLAARQALVRFASVGCTTADGLGTRPKCKDGQPEGTVIEFLPLGGPGEGTSVLPPDVAGVLDFEAGALYGAFSVKEELPVEPEFPRGAYALFFITDGGGAGTVILRLDDEGHIVRLDSLGGFPRDIYFQQKTADLMDTPPQNQTFSPEAAKILVYPPRMESLFTKTTAEASSPQNCPEGTSASKPPPLTSLPVETLAPTIKGYTMQSTCWEGEWYFTLAPSLNIVQPCVGQDADLSQDVPGYTVRGVDSLKALLDQLPAGEYITWCGSGRPGEDIVEDVIAHSRHMGINLTLMTDLETDSPSQPAEIPSTGIPLVDQAIAATMENDLESRRNLIHYTTVRCTHEIVGMGGPPFCEPGQEEGTPVEKFPIMGPEGGYIDPAEIDRVLTFRVEELYGVFRRAEEEVPDPSAPFEAFGLLFTTSSTLDERSHILVYLDEEGKIVSLDFVFWSLHEHLQKIVGEWLIPPQPATDSSTANSLHVASIAQDGVRLWGSENASIENWKRPEISQV